ncbi:beta-caryophyllene synthase [Tanacetum coccineum]|uniref:Beta-caryophyllene synthase n=1 Tax=Tanacetum coccineum TaxID=301880 RepID=A0ABQ5GKY8_9ASTR
MNDDTPIGVAYAVQEGVTPSVVDMTIEMEKQNLWRYFRLLCAPPVRLGYFVPPLSTSVTTTAGNAPGKSSYANSIRAISERFANTAYGFFLGKRVAYPVVANYVRNTWGKYGLVRSMFSSSTGLFSFQFSSMDGLDAMLENGPWFIRNNPLILKKWHPDENLLKEDVSTVPVWVKLHGVPVTAFSEDGLSAIATKLGTPLMLDSYTSDMCMQSWGRSSYARVMIELRADVELKDNIVVAMPKITREGHYTCVVEKKTVKKHSQTSRGVLVGPKMWKCMEPTIEVSNSNPFDALISVDNDVEFGTNGGTTNLVSNGATSGKLRLLDNDRNPLVPLGIVESDSEVEVVFDETANLRISTSGKDGSDKGYGTNSLLEQWRDSYPDNDYYDPYDDDMDSYGNSDYDDDPYDDDMYEGQDLSHELQAICNNLDIRVRGRKKK